MDSVRRWLMYCCVQVDESVSEVAMDSGAGWESVRMAPPQVLVIGGVLPNVSDFRTFINFTGVISSKPSPNYLIQR